MSNSSTTIVIDLPSPEEKLKGIFIKESLDFGAVLLEGFVDGRSVISMSNRVDGSWSVGSSSCLPSQADRAAMYVECMSRVFKRAMDSGADIAQQHDAAKQGASTDAEAASLLQLADQLEHAATVSDLGRPAVTDDFRRLAAAALRRQATSASQSEAGESRLVRNLRDEIDAMQRNLTWYAQQFKMMNDHAAGSVWYWQGDGQDHPESLVNSLPVVIRADQLRDLIAQSTAHTQGSQPEQSAADEASWLVDGSLVYRLSDDRRPQNCDEIRVQQVDGDRHDQSALHTRANYIAGLLNAASATKPAS